MAQKPKTVRVSEETWVGLRAITQYGEDLDSTIQKLIRFYLNKPEESKKSRKRQIDQ